MAETYKVVVDDNGTISWFDIASGLRHRLNGPAIEQANGNKYYYQNDKRHRLDGPAIEWSNGDKSWFINDLLHRLDGPAIECANGEKYWCINGEELTEEEFNARTMKHSIVIDGKTIEISHESFEALKKSLID